MRAAAARFGSKADDALNSWKEFRDERRMLARALGPLRANGLKRGLNQWLKHVEVSSSEEW